MRARIRTGLLLLPLMVGLALPAATLAASQDEASPWQRIDALNDDKDFDGAYALLSMQEAGGHAGYLWRMARHHFNKSDNTTDEEVIERELYAGLDYAGHALAADSTSASAHGYYGILIGRVGEIEGTKQKIINSYDVRDHTVKAIELDGDNDSWHHVMGRWHFTLADLSWIERNVAKLIYAAPPKASFAEAEAYFQRAAELDPQDIRHFLWLGKARLELDKEDAAGASLEQAISLPSRSDSDDILQEEARRLLAGL